MKPVLGVAPSMLPRSLPRWPALCMGAVAGLLAGWSAFSPWLDDPGRPVWQPLPGASLIGEHWMADAQISAGGHWHPLRATLIPGQSEALCWTGWNPRARGGPPQLGAAWLKPKIPARWRFSSHQLALRLRFAGEVYPVDPRPTCLSGPSNASIGSAILSTNPIDWSASPPGWWATAASSEALASMR